jgi:di/tricarboxylate transporter
MLKPFVANLAEPRRAWLVVAMASTLAGNFTLVGSVANLIVAQRAQSVGIRISFWDYFKVGAPLTVASIFLCIWRYRSMKSESLRAVTQSTERHPTVRLAPQSRLCGEFD